MSTGFLEDASFNQSPAFGDVDLFSADKPLADAAARYGLDLEALATCGKDYGSAETLDLGRLANENPPRLRTMDGKGNRLDFVEFHPAYHALMAKSIGWGIHSSAHDGSEPAGPDDQPRDPALSRDPGRERPSLPDHHDACLHRRAQGRAGRCSRSGWPRSCRANTTRGRCRGGRRPASRSAWA